MGEYMHILSCNDFSQLHHVLSSHALQHASPVSSSPHDCQVGPPFTLREVHASFEGMTPFGSPRADCIEADVSLTHLVQTRFDFSTAHLECSHAALQLDESVPHEFAGINVKTSCSSKASTLRRSANWPIGRTAVALDADITRLHGVGRSADGG
jgi:hypothetical protein